jgi:hypothetical protein
MERVAAVQAIGKVPNVLPEVSKCGRISWNGTYYESAKYMKAELDDYIDMAQEKHNNIDVDDEDFSDELFDLMGATGNFKNIGTEELVSRAKEMKTYAEYTNFYGGLAQEGQFKFIARLQYETYSEYNVYLINTFKKY